MSEGKFENRVARLQSELEKLDTEVAKKARCAPTIMIIAVICPILMWLMLYFVQPGFVQTKEGTRMTRSKYKVFFWTIMLTLCVWGGLFFYSYCKGYKGGKMCIGV